MHYYRCMKNMNGQIKNEGEIALWNIKIKDL